MASLFRHWRYAITSFLYYALHYYDITIIAIAGHYYDYDDIAAIRLLLLLLHTPLTLPFHVTLLPLAIFFLPLSLLIHIIDITYLYYLHYYHYYIDIIKVIIAIVILFHYFRIFSFISHFHCIDFISPLYYWYCYLLIIIDYIIDCRLSIVLSHWHYATLFSYATLRIVITSLRYWPLLIISLYITLLRCTPHYHCILAHYRYADTFQLIIIDYHWLLAWCLHWFFAAFFRHYFDWFHSIFISSIALIFWQSLPIAFLWHWLLSLPLYCHIDIFRWLAYTHYYYYLFSFFATFRQLSLLFHYFHISRFIALTYIC